MRNPKNLSFEPPGPGCWNTDGLHTPKPITRMKHSMYSVLPTGMRTGGARYGVLSDGIVIAVLHRFVYATPRFLVSRPPGNDEVSKALFVTQVAANPEVQERFERSEFALTTKRWRADRDHWDSVGKPWMMGRTLSMTDRNPAAMTDAELVLHVQEALHHLERASEYHHILNLVPTLPRCLLFLDTSLWTGLSLAELEPLLLGSSPISAGDEPELRVLCDLLDQDAGAVKDLTSGAAAADLVEAFSARTDALGQAFRDYVRMVGYRTLDGWEPMNPYILETPELLIEKITHGLKRDYPQMDHRVVQDIRDRVPKAKQAAFDELLEDARSTSRVKDERDLYCNMPVSGLLRRGVIEAGRRAAAKGLVAEVEHMTEASVGELAQLLNDGRHDLAEELADRYHYRMKYSIDDVPAVIGDPAEAIMPVDADWLPGHANRMMKAIEIGFMLDADMEDPESRAATVKGRPVSPGVFEGIARVVMEADEIREIQQGEILVTRSTNPAFNIVLPRLGALVTQYGGMLSHAAIVSREFGLPGVVGCKGITGKVQTGDRLTVNGDTGDITIHPN